MQVLVVTTRYMDEGIFSKIFKITSTIYMYPGAGAGIK